MPILHHWTDVAPETTGGTIVKRRLRGQGADLVRVEIKAGTEAPRHAHPYEQFVQVLSGAGTLETAEGHAAFTSGSLFHFPPDTWHAARFDEDTILVETNFERRDA